MIKKGDPLIIREVGNGIMVETYSNMNATVSFEDTLAFNRQQDFLKWIKNHLRFKDTDYKLNDKRSTQSSK